MVEMQRTFECLMQGGANGEEHTPSSAWRGWRTWWPFAARQARSSEESASVTSRPTVDSAEHVAGGTAHEFPTALSEHAAELDLAKRSTSPGGFAPLINARRECCLRDCDEPEIMVYPTMTGTGAVAAAE
eukprot:4024769-Amphidinium_carterae.1